MAMTKSEKARVEELETALAMHWPAYPMPAPMTRQEIEAELQPLTPRDQSVTRGSRVAALGWFYNKHTGLVSQGWSSGHLHNTHNITGDSASQGCGRMFRTHREAAMALRLEMSRDFAAKLAAVDRLIAGQQP